MKAKLSTRALFVALAALMAYPFMPFASEYVLHVMILMMVYMVLAMGLNIVPGFCGLLDLGFVGFYGIGAYTSGLLTIHYGVPFWFIVPLAALNGALWGVLLGAPTLRLTGDYFAIVTFGFSELVVLFLTNEIWLTRGPLGLPGIDPVSIDLTWLNEDWFWEFLGEKPYFHLAALMVGGVWFVVRRLEDSRLGRAWFAIRADSLAAASCGVNILNYKVIAFAISASIGALGGAFFARWTLFLSPDMFKFWESFLVLCMIVLGGLGNVYGALVGAAVLTALGEVLREVLPVLGMPPEVRFLAYGLIMVLIMRFKPGGFFPAIATSGRSNPALADVQRRMAAHGATGEGGGGTAS
ncbi:branched-chain amino acid transport system permease protein [Desulfobaculum xiamenense]|uniref:Branched-chain amino acid transport system permease protein n=1 Tax=Desulfobaculum xiamenense TaxID=995050 RepID=A0A846QMD5_9BACT|nr:branched-chain amino acid ABC transporter permease [Desulfobaculum xiamenense]NJB67393.1 branched-chain amino acid transport system permease protein [Desulfobaculum xiamenense]